MASILKAPSFLSPLNQKKAQAAVEGEVLDKESVSINEESDYGVVGVHHVGILCESLERSLDFYQNVLGLEINEARPNDEVTFRGAWLWIGSEMIHLIELPNPDPLTGRPEHGGRDRHTCIAIRDVSKLKAILDKAGKTSLNDITLVQRYLHHASCYFVLCRYSIHAFLKTRKIKGMS